MSLRVRAHPRSPPKRGIHVLVDRRDARLIVFTDEQARDPVIAPKSLGDMVNVASYQHGVSSALWRRLNGYPEALIRWIARQESEMR